MNYDASFPKPPASWRRVFPLVMPRAISDYTNHISSHLLHCLFMLRLKGQGVLLPLPSSLTSPSRPYVTERGKPSFNYYYLFSFIYYTDTLKSNSSQNCWQEQGERLLRCCTLGEGRGQHLPSREQLDNLYRAGQDKATNTGKARMDTVMTKAEVDLKQVFLGSSTRLLWCLRGAWACSEASESFRVRWEQHPPPLWDHCSQEGRMGFSFFFITSVKSHSPYSMSNGTWANSRIQEDLEQDVISTEPLARASASQQEVRSENHGNVGWNLGSDEAIDLQSGHISVSPMTKGLQSFKLTLAKK